MDKVKQKEIAIQCLEKLDIYKPYIKKFKSEAGTLASLKTSVASGQIRNRSFGIRLKK